MTNYKEQSKKLWGTDRLSPATEELQLGCLQRIADATELMAQNHRDLISEKEKYERWYRQERAEKEALQRSLVAHKANYTRLKNKLDVLQRQQNELLEEKYFRGGNNNEKEKSE